MINNICWHFLRKTNAQNPIRKETKQSSVHEHIVKKRRRKKVLFRLTPKIRQQKLTFKDGLQLSEKPNVNA